MAKRFTDTLKWNKSSFAQLSPIWKLVWIYLCDNCDHGGIWDVNLRLLEFHIGEIIEIDDILNKFGEKVVRLSSSKIFMKDFVEFQYKNLNPNNRVHKSILDRLEKEGVTKGLARTLQGPKEEEEEKDKEEERGSGGKPESLHPLANLWNENCGSLPAVKLISKSRLKKIRDIWPKHDLDEWRSLIERVANSPWCTGGNASSWRATFDWFIKPDSVAKVSEGNYDPVASNVRQLSGPNGVW